MCTPDPDSGVTGSSRTRKGCRSGSSNMRGTDGANMPWTCTICCPWPQNAASFWPLLFQWSPLLPYPTTFERKSGCKIQQGLPRGTASAFGFGSSRPGLLGRIGGGCTTAVPLWTFFFSFDFFWGDNDGSKTHKQEDLPGIAVGAWKSRTSPLRTRCMSSENSGASGTSSSVWTTP
jgi:hypothetical protein